MIPQVVNWGIGGTGTCIWVLEYAKSGFNPTEPSGGADGTKFKKNNCNSVALASRGVFTDWCGRTKRNFAANVAGLCHRYPLRYQLSGHEGNDPRQEMRLPLRAKRFEIWPVGG